MKRRIQTRNQRAAKRRTRQSTFRTKAATGKTTRRITESLSALAVAEKQKSTAWGRPENRTVSFTMTGYRPHSKRTPYHQTTERPQSGTERRSSSLAVKTTFVTTELNSASSDAVEKPIGEAPYPVETKALRANVTKLAVDAVPQVEL